MHAGVLAHSVGYARPLQILVMSDSADFTAMYMKRHSGAEYKVITNPTPTPYPNRTSNSDHKFNQDPDPNPTRSSRASRPSARHPARASSSRYGGKQVKASQQVNE